MRWRSISAALSCPRRLASWLSRRFVYRAILHGGTAIETRNHRHLMSHSSYLDRSRTLRLRLLRMLCLIVDHLLDSLHIRLE